MGARICMFGFFLVWSHWRSACWQDSEQEAEAQPSQGQAKKQAYHLGWSGCQRHLQATETDILLSSRLQTIRKEA